MVNPHLGLLFFISITNNFRIYHYTLNLYPRRGRALLCPQTDTFIQRIYHPSFHAKLLQRGFQPRPLGEVAIILDCRRGFADTQLLIDNSIRKGPFHHGPLHPRVPGLRPWTPSRTMVEVNDGLSPLCRLSGFLHLKNPAAFI